ncbi:MAG: DUF4147 domain-containing protein [Thermoplasmatales archaeon]|nr:DUF4147 domain-containing protein [Thermoplasmatales archaeon]
MSNSKSLIQNYEEIGTSNLRRKILDLIDRSISEFYPATIMNKEIGALETEFQNMRRLFIIGFGKCSLSMFKGLPDSLTERAEYSGVIVPKNLETGDYGGRPEVLKGNHPIIGMDTEVSSRKLLSKLSGLSEDDTVIVLISGGGSALFEIPEDGITYDFIASISKCIMNNGGDIDELNAVRQSISKVKGGKLAGMLYPSRVFSFVISDVPGDREDIIASGPLVMAQTTKEERKNIIRKFELFCPDLNKIDDRYIDYKAHHESFERVKQKIILKNHDIVQFFVDKLRNDGDSVVDLGSNIQGNVKDASEYFVERMKKACSMLGPSYVIGGGETTVDVRGNGIGGRNCELSVRVARLMDKDDEFMFSSIGTDGIDGISPAMGGIVDKEFVKETSKAEMDESLKKNDTYNLLNKRRSAIITGFTENNVSDIMIGYYGGKY